MKFTVKIRSKIVNKCYRNWIKPSNSVLDIGAGNGVMAGEIKKSFKCKVTGTDVLNYLDVPLPFVKMSAPDKLPFKDETFDVAMLNDVLHHIDSKNQSKVILEALRIAKYALILEDPPSFTSRSICFILNKIHNPKMYLPETFRSSENWKRMFKSLGLKYEFVKVDIPWWYPLKHFAFRVWK